MTTRFSPEAAQKLRTAIAEAGGIEVFAIGRMGTDQHVADLDVHCRGNREAVPASLRKPSPGEVVIHNHPSGVLEASPADMTLANLYGDDGIGVVIVDNDVRRALWVVEPMLRRVERLDPDEVRAFFTDRLPGAVPGYETRPGQLEMSLRVVDALNDGEVALLEAGTGTGKSLAYLVPAALWALKNESRVAVSTFTIALQGQLMRSDLPLLRKAGLDVRFACMMGRHNYTCRRKLERAVADPGKGDEAKAIRALADWAASTPDGTRADLAFPVDEEDWDRVSSDADQTLRVRCPHYGDCFYYSARRAAADAHVLVVNHHLLLADLDTKHDSGGVGVLPRYDRVVLDEGHHLEDAATLLFESKLGIEGLRRSVRALRPRRRRPGALNKLRDRYLGGIGPMGPEDVAQATTHLDALHHAVEAIHTDAPAWLETVGDAARIDELPSVRTTTAWRDGSTWTDQIEPVLGTIQGALRSAIRPLDGLLDVLDVLPDEVKTQDAQLLFDLKRARRRLGDKAQTCSEFHGGNDAFVTWLERDRSHRIAPAARIALAPIDVGPLLRDRVFEGVQATVVTSATLTVARQFDHLRNRIGLGDCERVTTGRFESPFDFRHQALLGIPRDLPSPKEAGFEERVGDVVVDAIRVSDGGAFVLCTSYALVDALCAHAQQTLGHEYPLMKQGQMSRQRLLDRFREDRRSVLFGTDSFWEGIDVKGDALRMVIIPRLPFRVPTEPVQQARFERLEAQGLDPFRAYSLPQAVLRFRQGFGRLIRTQSDRGVVLLLDRRAINQWYGQVFLRSLPEVNRAQGPSRAVLQRVERHLDSSG